MCQVLLTKSKALEISGGIMKNDDISAIAWLCEKISVKSSTAIKNDTNGAAEKLLLSFFYSIQWIL